MRKQSVRDPAEWGGGYNKFLLYNTTIRILQTSILFHIICACVCTITLYTGKLTHTHMSVALPFATHIIITPENINRPKYRQCLSHKCDMAIFFGKTLLPTKILLQDRTHTNARIMHSLAEENDEKQLFMCFPFAARLCVCVLGVWKGKPILCVVPFPLKLSLRKASTMSNVAAPKKVPKSLNSRYFANLTWLPK